ncbi:dUTP diphosphatase [Monocercomonoides exilis]|uniref:dUTP diphosphatase n=1 Tax=Monocercomonoides exilis TaxID=2049356 RepID=UPI00355AAA8B|nr:dUTP diphosphatase [Monocercomonoides exilis]|eukprot:MONOS_3004.1-p1 / transcript=MONOS_3004.1 / gene=MONOS_3004 / organism=Monocercomonoides_exilis_PA203 / gene_product=dUTP diphosphatase [EC:3.6.1.23] / transcript_product=dUTP diphosphatase [EC:3.6.1.23] / location=Mono_scaffold00066:126154-126879(+) / protein_length=152 / sequence_SO=supercontig / SO=protein_coding / is_pseudo=false
MAEIKRPIVQFKKLSPDAILPVRGSLQAAGLDLFSNEENVIPARGRCAIQTGLTMILPDGCYGRVASRSGLSLKEGIEVGAGVIDPDYRGPIIVILYNHTDHDYQVKKGAKIAQLICTPFISADVVEFTTSPISGSATTERGEKGFGSTGF